MLHFIATLKNGSQKTLTLNELFGKHSVYISDEDISENPEKWFEDGQWAEIFECEVGEVKVKAVLDDWNSDLKKLSPSGREMLSGILNTNHFTEFEEASALEAKILTKYALEIFGKIPDGLKDPSTKIKMVEELTEKLEAAKPGDKEEILQEAQSIMKQLITRGVASIRDKVFQNLQKASQGTNVSASFDSFEIDMKLADAKVSAKDKAKIIESGITLHRIPSATLESAAEFISEKVKEDLIEESHYHANIIKALRYFNGNLLKKAVKDFAANKSAWHAILDVYKLSDKEVELLSKQDEAFEAMAEHGYITKDTVTEKMIAQDPEFFATLPWVMKDEKLILQVAKAAEGWRISQLAEKLLKSKNEKVEKIVISKLNKRELARHFDSLSDDGKDKAQALLLADIKASEADYVLSALAGRLNEKDAEKIEKLAVKTIDGAVETVRSSTNESIRKLAITRLLSSDVQRNKLFALEQDYNLTETEIKRIAEYIKEREYSSYQLSKVAPELLLADQKAFKKQLMALVCTGRWDHSNTSDRIFSEVSEEILASCLNEYKDAHSSLLSKIEKIGAKRLANAFLNTGFNLEDYLELLSQKEELDMLVAALPKSKRFHGADLLTESPKSLNKKNVIYVLEHMKGESQKPALEWLFTNDPQTFEAQDLRRMQRALDRNGEYLPAFVQWAKKNREYFGQEILNKGRDLDSMIATEEDMKQAVFLIRAVKNEKNPWIDLELVNICADKFPALALNQPDLLTTSEMDPVFVFSAVLAAHPDLIDASKHKDMIIKAAATESNSFGGASKFSAESIVKMTGSDTEKIDLYLALNGDAKSEVLQMMSNEAFADIVMRNVSYLMKQHSIAPADLVGLYGNVQVLNELPVSEEMLIEDYDYYNVRGIYKNCTNHKEAAFNVILKKTKELRYIPTSDLELIGYRLLEELSVDEIRGLKNFYSLAQLADSIEFDSKIREKILQAVNQIPNGVQVKGKIVGTEHGAELTIIGNDVIQNHFGGDFKKSDIILSVPVERASQFISAGSEIKISGITGLLEGAPIIKIDIDEEIATAIVKNGNKEINEIVKEKQRKLVDSKNLLESLSPKRKWKMSINLQGKPDKNHYRKDAVTYELTEAIDAIQKGLADAHNVTKRASTVKTSPLIKYHQDKTWGVPKYVGGRSQPSDRKAGEILSPNYKGAEAMKEAEAVLDRLTAEVDIKSIVLKIDISDLMESSPENMYELQGLIHELEPFLVLTGAFSGGNQVWGDEYMDSIEAQVSKENQEIRVTLKGRFSKGKGIANTLGMALGAIEAGVQAGLQRRLKILSGEIDETSQSLKQIVEGNLDMKKIMKSSLMLKTLAGQKMLFSA